MIICLKTTSVANAAVFLLTDHEEDTPEQDCLATIEETHSSRPDLKNIPLENPVLESHTDGSSFIHNGKQMSELAIATVNKIKEAEASSSSAQEAKLIALTRTLNFNEGRVNIWTDSKYAFGMVHAHGVTWEE